MSSQVDKPIQHITIDGGERYLPLAQKMLTRMRERAAAAGVMFGSRVIDMPDARIQIQFQGRNERIDIKGGGKVIIDFFVWDLWSGNPAECINIVKYYGEDLDPGLYEGAINEIVFSVGRAPDEDTSWSSGQFGWARLHNWPGEVTATCPAAEHLFWFGYTGRQIWNRPNDDGIPSDEFGIRRVQNVLTMATALMNASRDDAIEGGNALRGYLEAMTADAEQGFAHEDGAMPMAMAYALASRGIEVRPGGMIHAYYYDENGRAARTTFKKDDPEDSLYGYSVVTDENGAPRTILYEPEQFDGEDFPFVIPPDRGQPPWRVMSWRTRVEIPFSSLVEKPADQYITVEEGREVVRVAVELPHDPIPVIYDPAGIRVATAMVNADSVPIEEQPEGFIWAYPIRFAKLDYLLDDSVERSEAEIDYLTSVALRVNRIKLKHWTAEHIVGNGGVMSDYY